MTTLVARLRAIPSWQVTFGVALLALGFLIAAQLQSEGPRVRYTTQEREPLVQTALGLQGQQDGLKDRILAIRQHIQDLEQQGQGNATLVRQLNVPEELAGVIVLNERSGDFEDALHEGDRVTLIPPLAGG